MTLTMTTENNNISFINFDNSHNKSDNSTNKNIINNHDNINDDVILPEICRIRNFFGAKKINDFKVLEPCRKTYEICEFSSCVLSKRRL